MTVQFLDPRAAPAAAPEPYDLSVDVDAPVTIGLVANGFPDSERFLDHVEQALSETLPHAAMRRYRKHNLAAPVGDELLATIAAECDALIGAYGH